MKSQVQKWGNSLAIRIPKSFADEVGLKDASAVNLSLVEGKLVISPAKTRRKYRLEELVAQITDENRPTEFDTGSAVGKEAW